MKRGLRWGAYVVAALLFVAAALYLSTMGDYPVAATVTDDDSLPRIEVGSVTLHGESHGDPADPAIVVLHGGPGGDYRSLLPLSALSDRFHVTFYDQRGAGLSQRVPAGALTLDTHLDELATLLDQVSPDAPAILIGHSWGAMLASGFLGRYPDRVAQAVLIEPGFLSAQAAVEWNAHMRGILRQPLMRWRALRTGFAASHVDGPDAEASADYLIGRMMRFLASHPDSGYTCNDAPYDSPTWRAGATSSQAFAESATSHDLDSLGQNAGRFGGPVLILTGACSTWIGEEVQRRNLAFFHDARLEVIENAGHDTVDDAPEATLHAIRGFLAAGR